MMIQNKQMRQQQQEPQQPLRRHLLIIRRQSKKRSKEYEKEVSNVLGMPQRSTLLKIVPGTSVKVGDQIMVLRFYGHGFKEKKSHFLFFLYTYSSGSGIAREYIIKKLSTLPYKVEVVLVEEFLVAEESYNSLEGSEYEEEEEEEQEKQKSTKHVNNAPPTAAPLVNIEGANLQQILDPQMLEEEEEGERQQLQALALQQGSLRLLQKPISKQDLVLIKQNRKLQEGLLESISLAKKEREKRLHLKHKYNEILNTVDNTKIEKKANNLKLLLFQASLELLMLQERTHCPVTYDSFVSPAPSKKVYSLDGCKHLFSEEAVEKMVLSIKVARLYGDEFCPQNFICPICKSVVRVAFENFYAKQFLILNQCFTDIEAGLIPETLLFGSQEGTQTQISKCKEYLEFQFGKMTKNSAFLGIPEMKNPPPRTNGYTPNNPRHTLSLFEQKFRDPKIDSSEHKEIASALRLFLKWNPDIVKYATISPLELIR